MGWLESIGKGVAVVGTGCVAATKAATAGLAYVGFTSGGVAASSTAAGIQSGIGNVVGGSLFAACQSVGATGGFSILGPVGITGAAVAGAIYYGRRLL